LSTIRKTKVAVIGGGWAGFSAAVELADAGIPVTVFETAPNLGGRARGFLRNGLQLDNGQHILLGAYRETLRLLGKIGVSEADVLLRLPLRLETPGHLKLAATRLPAPFHLLLGIFTAQGLSLGEKWAALGFVTQLRLSRFKTAQQATVAELLSGQPEKLVRLFWEPLCIGALNTPLDQASAQVFLNVLRDSFSRTRSDSDLLLCRVDLGRLFPHAAADFVRQRGGMVHTTTPVASIENADNGIEVNGEWFSHAICATGPHALPRLLRNQPEMTMLTAQLANFTYQPITTIYLQYPENTALAFPMLGMASGLGQWVFDRGTLCGQPGLLAVVISADGPHLTLDHDQLASKIDTELRQMLGTLPRPQWHQVIVEKRATFACTPGLQRPGHATPNPHIFIAGDYTAGDYPATLEGAVRSGVQCATLLISKLAA
jgi:squalene-associated FAD-dependent desaturase